MAKTLKPTFVTGPDGVTYAILDGKLVPVAAPAASPASGLPGWVSDAQAAQSRPAAPARATRTEATAKVVETLPLKRVLFDSKPSKAQREAMKTSGGFAHRIVNDGRETWYWILPAS